MRKIWEAIRNRGRFENDMAGELQFHIEARAADLERQGHSKTEALRLARLEMGAVEHYKEECRRARGLQFVDEVRSDLIYALRGLAKNRAFAVVAILTLTLGIGANATIFALVNSVMFKSLPVEKPEQLQAVYWTIERGRPQFARNSSGSSSRDGNLRVADMFAWPHFTRFRKELPPAVELFAFSERDRITIEVNRQAQLAQSIGTSWNYFRGLGVSAYLGRTFLPEDEDPQALATAVILSHEFWTRVFGANPSVLGTSVRIAEGTATVIGVLPPGFHGLSPGSTVDVVMTLPAYDRIYNRKSLQDGRSWWVKMMARVQPPHSVASVRGEIEARLIALMKAEQAREPWDTPAIRLVSAERGLHWLRTQFEQPLRLMMLVALLILVMASVNVGGLLLARSEARVAETAARLALGASRFRIARQHLTESLLLACLGLAGGVLVSVLLGSSLPWLLAQGGQPPILDLRPDWRFLVVAATATLFVAMLFGLYPAWKSSRIALLTALKRTHGARTGRLPLGRVLVGVQVGVSLVLLVGAAMFLRTVSNLRSLNIGFVPGGILTFVSDPTLAGYRGDRATDYFERALEKLSSVPGVRSVTVSRHGLLTGGASSGDFHLRGEAGNKSRFEAYSHNVTPGYFATTGVPILTGRDITDADRKRTPGAALVNQSFARALRPNGESPLGLTLYRGENGEEPAEIVGVVGDARYDSLRRDAPPTVYSHFYNRPQRQGTFAMRTAGDPRSLAEAVRRAMTEVDPRVPIYALRTQEEQLSIAMEQERILALLLSGFGALAVVLAAIGIYGVLSYSVARRTSEIGVRLALGALPNNLRWMIIAESLVPVALGLSAGLAAAWWFAGLVKTLVFGLQGLDLWSVTTGTIVLALGAAFAAFVPANRASRVAPMNALRYE